jgi:hypothetical protein
MKTTYDAINALEAIVSDSRYKEYLYWDNSKGYYWADSTACAVSQLVCNRIEFLTMVNELRAGS